MANDLEQQLYRDMADLTEKVPKLQNEIISLKKRLTKLSNRIESLELLSLQDQISNLNDELASTNRSVITLRRTVVSNEMDTLKLHMLRAIRNALPKGDPNKIRLSEHIRVEFSKARERIKISPQPLDVLDDFEEECEHCSIKYNLGAFATKP